MSNQDAKLDGAMGNYCAIDDPNFLLPIQGLFSSREEEDDHHLWPKEPDIRNGDGHLISMEPYLHSETSGRIHAGDEEDQVELPF